MSSLDEIVGGLAEEYSPLRTGGKRLSKHEAEAQIKAWVAEAIIGELKKMPDCEGDPEDHPLWGLYNVNLNDAINGYNKAIDQAVEVVQRVLEES